MHELMVWNGQNGTHVSAFFFLFFKCKCKRRHVTLNGRHTISECHTCTVHARVWQCALCAPFPQILRVGADIWRFVRASYGNLFQYVFCHKCSVHILLGDFFLVVFISAVFEIITFMCMSICVFKCFNFILKSLSFFLATCRYPDERWWCAQMHICTLICTTNDFGWVCFTYMLRLNCVRASFATAMVPIEVSIDRRSLKNLESSEAIRRFAEILTTMDAINLQLIDIIYSIMICDNSVEITKLSNWNLVRYDGNCALLMLNYFRMNPLAFDIGAIPLGFIGYFFFISLPPNRWLNWK